MSKIIQIAIGNHDEIYGLDSDGILYHKMFNDISGGFYWQMILPYHDEESE